MDSNNTNKKIYFISDFHLGAPDAASSLEREKLIVKFLDEIKNDASYDYLKERHYINVERDATYVKTKDPNAVNELELVIALL